MKTGDIVFDGKSLASRASTVFSRAYTLVNKLDIALLGATNSRTTECHLEIIEGNFYFAVQVLIPWCTNDDEQMYEVSYPDILNSSPAIEPRLEDCNDIKFLTDAEIKIMRSFLPKLNRLREELSCIEALVLAFANYTKVNHLKYSEKEIIVKLASSEIDDSLANY